MAPIVVISGKEEPNNLARRHIMAWRQLSLLWNIPVSFRSFETIAAHTEPAMAYSVAVSEDEIQAAASLTGCYASAPVVTFLENTGIDIHDRPLARRQQEKTGSNGYCNTFRMAHRNPLLKGVPDILEIPAPGISFTLIPDRPALEILVRHQGLPIIALNPPHLLAGVDPWQFGAPAAPMLYPILSNWLHRIVKNIHPRMEPLAIIRIDDLPLTAEKIVMLGGTISPRLDRARARMIRRLRRFAQRTGGIITMMYSSHYQAAAQGPVPIAPAMPASIQEMAMGVKSGALEIGCHGMIHLRDPASGKKELDPREFLDLDQEETRQHLKACEAEIRQRFGVSPTGFVAPAWGYNPGITKQVAGRRYRAIVDSCRHVASGQCGPLLSRDPEAGFVNLTETMGPGRTMLAYADPGFWRCYAAAGIPIHYMQHRDNNRELFKQFIMQQVDPQAIRANGLQARLAADLEDRRRSFFRRALSLGLLTLLTSARISRQPGAWKYLWKTLTSSSLYTFVKAMQSAGYRCVGFSGLLRAAPTRDRDS
ncbi:MAG: hypothetical protein L3J03_05390 [Desulfobacterales bacterium]|nr:hypothetical protein [Desulfobacterales bacterium]